MDHLPEQTGPVAQAEKNIAFVIERRLADEFDEEQAQQALEVLNGTRRED